jgi:hypothetical protein
MFIYCFTLKLNKLIIYLHFNIQILLQKAKIISTQNTLRAAATAPALFSLNYRPISPVYPSVF